MRGPSLRPGLPHWAARATTSRTARKQEPLLLHDKPVRRRARPAPTAGNAPSDRPAAQSTLSVRMPHGCAERRRKPRIDGAAAVASENERLCESGWNRRQTPPLTSCPTSRLFSLPYLSERVYLPAQWSGPVRWRMTWFEQHSRFGADADRRCGNLRARGDHLASRDPSEPSCNQRARPLSFLFPNLFSSGPLFSALIQTRNREPSDNGSIARLGGPTGGDGAPNNRSLNPKVEGSIPSRPIVGAAGREPQAGRSGPAPMNRPRKSRMASTVASVRRGQASRRRQPAIDTA